MRLSKWMRAGALASSFIVAGAAGAQGKVVVSHDEWFTQPGDFNANEQQFVHNITNWFGLSSGSSVLIYSNNSFLTNSTFTGYLNSLGISTTISTTPASFSGYGTVFTEGNPTLDAAGLGAYVFGGGKVVDIGGTGIPNAPGEAGYSNPFLSQFGLAFASSYNGIGTVNTSGFAAQGPFGAALFTGVASIYGNNGSDVLTATAVAGVTNQVFYDPQQNGVYAAAAVNSTPEPGSLALVGTGLIGLVPLVRRRKND